MGYPRTPRASSLLAERREEVVDVRFGERGERGSGFEDRVGEVALSLLQPEHALLDAAGDDEAVHEYGPRLAHAVRAIRRLRLGCRVPPRLVVNRSEEHTSEL